MPRHHSTINPPQRSLKEVIDEIKEILPKLSKKTLLYLTDNTQKIGNILQEDTGITKKALRAMIENNLFYKSKKDLEITLKNLKDQLNQLSEEDGDTKKSSFKETWDNSEEISQKMYKQLHERLRNYSKEDLRIDTVTNCIYSKDGILVKYLEDHKDLKIPEGITKIGRGAFKSTDIKTVQCPDSLQEIEDYAFFDSDLEDIQLSKKIIQLGEHVFSFCKNLNKLELPNDLKNFGKECFGYSGIKDINIPDQIEEIPEGCFCSCYNLEEIKGKSIKIIKESAFSCTHNLKRIEFPQCETIEQEAFSTDLTTIVLPKIKVIGKQALPSHQNRLLKEIKLAIKKGGTYTSKDGIYKIDINPQVRIHPTQEI